MKVLALSAGAGLLGLLLNGCAAISQSPEPAKPFQFRSLTLRQNDEAGDPLWELRSPAAGTNLIIAKRLSPLPWEFSIAKENLPTGSVHQRAC